MDTEDGELPVINFKWDSPATILNAVDSWKAQPLSQKNTWFQAFLLTVAFPSCHGHVSLKKITVKL